MYPLEQQINQLVVKLERMPARSVGIYFLYCAERLFPLFEAFSNKSGWGEVAYLRNLLDSLWSTNHSLSSANYVLESEKVNEQIPNVDDFDNLEATFAQDFCICVDAALLAFADTPSLALIEYVFEPLRCAISLKKYGVLDVGSEKEVEFEGSILNDDLMKLEIEFHNKALELVEVNDVDNVSKYLRNLAVQSCWTVDKLR